MKIKLIAEIESVDSCLDFDNVEITIPDETTWPQAVRVYLHFLSVCGYVFSTSPDDLVEAMVKEYDSQKETSK